MEDKIENIKPLEEILEGAREDHRVLRQADLVHGHAYAINARNAYIGVWNSAVRGFVIPRSKFGDTFLFTEFERDTSKSFGTARAFVDLGPCPFDDFESDELLAWLVDRRDHATNIMEKEIFGWK